MKKKFLVLTLCFTLIFTSINYKKSYAFDGGVVSVPMIATISSLAIASGIVLSSDDDIFDITRIFYNKYRDRWEEVQQVFEFCVTVGANKVVTVGKEFLELVKNCFDDVFASSSSDFIGSGYLSYGANKNYPISVSSEGKSYFIGNKIDGKPLYLDVIRSSGYFMCSWNNSPEYLGGSMSSFGKISEGTWYLWLTGSGASTRLNIGDGVTAKYVLNSNWSLDLDFMSIPYDGTYSPDGVLDNDDSLDIYVPGNLGVLPGLNSDNVLNNPTYDLPIGGVVTVPGVNNPSIDYDDSISFPLGGSVEDNPSIPNDTPFSNITEYIISLVVPSDSYWTDTWGGLYNNFTNSFPLVDMSNFDKLVTGEKKFPNIDVNIMGVSGRIVNGDVVNSIVDWLRPIIAGFMMLCLMLFNYRKIYKTIRGVEPFQGIAQGTSDFRTGISEYNYMGTGLSKSDYEANERELAKALHDHYEDTGKTYKVRI